jgi:GT2 family glycosyltransferase
VTARVTVVVVNWNGEHLLPACLDALRGEQVWVVDNASADGSRALLAERYPHVRVLANGANLGFAGGNNTALREVTTPYVALLNNDAVPEPGWLPALAAVLDAEPRTALVGSKVLLQDRDLLNSAGGWVDRLGHGRDRGYLQPDDGRWDTPGPVFYAPATAVLVRTAALAEVGLFDDDYFLYYEDVDLCWRLRAAGWDVRYAPSAVVRHAHSASAETGSDLHTFHDGRNRLLTVVKNAPAACALAAAARLPVTAAGRLARRQPRAALVLLRAWLSFLRLLPSALRKRRQIGRTATVSRRALDRLRAELA